MDQQKEQTKPDYAKYDTAPGYPPPGYAQPPSGYGQTPPPAPQYAPVQPYPNRQYAPYPYRRASRPVLPLFIIAAVILIMLGIAVGTSFLSVGKAYSQAFPTSIATTVHIQADSVDLNIIANPGSSGVKFDADNVATFDAQQNGNDITLKVKAPQGFLFSFHPSKVDVLMPQGISLDLDTASGNVTANGGGQQDGQVKAHSGSGDIKFSNVLGNTDLETGSGDITLTSMQGASLKAHSGSGDLKLAQANPTTNLDVETGSGDIDYTGSLAATSNLANTGSGDITFHLAPYAGFQADWHTGSGDISNDFGLGEGKDVTSKTNNGSITALPTLTIKTGSGDINVLKGQ